MRRPPGAPQPYGAFATVDSFGGGAAPLLAGFAVTLVALIIQIAGSLRWPDLALVVFCLAATLFLHVVHLTARAKGYAVTPDDVRQWYDDYEEPGRREVVAWELQHYRQCWLFLVRRARIFYNCAMLALFAGLGVLLVPTGPGHLSVLRWVAIGIVGAAAATELLEIVDQMLRRRSTSLRIIRWIAPADPPVAPPPFDRPHSG
jgi:hypothetical protein